MKYKAVIYDMNGVIIDDEHIHEEAFRNTLKSFNIELTHDLYTKYFAGQTDLAGYQNIANLFTINLPINDLLNKKGDIYHELFPKLKKTYPGVLETITALSKNYKLALTSSSVRNEVELITTEFAIKDMFQVLITGDDVKNGKPDPEPYLLTTSQLDIDPKESVVIEDSVSGIKSAISAGCRCVAITTTHSKEQLLAVNPTKIINHFDEFDLELIESL